MKILNLYAGIGGNRKLWGDEHEITAVEYIPEIADIYHKWYPGDTVIVADAHQYLLHHFSEFDFIWASPPCPTHGRLNTAQHHQGIIRYPDMKLYQNIIFLKQWFKGRWLVENVIPYYEVLIHPTTMIDRHLFWSNFPIQVIKTERNYNVSLATNEQLADYFQIDLTELGTNRKFQRDVLRNIADPVIGAHILKAALKQTKQEAML